MFAVGLLLALNSGYINGLCLSGLLTKEGSYKQAVSAVTAAYTKSGLALADGLFKEFGFEFSLLLAFVGGAIVSGLMNPQAIPHKLAPSYGPTFLLGSLCLIAASIAADVKPSGRVHYFFAATANGMQNGMSSMYTANLIRTSHHTGTSTDIGLIVGQMLRGNWKNYWKFKVLVGLASSFWFGGFISFYAATAFLENSLWFSACLFLAIGITHVTFVVLTQKVSFFQASFGTWKWEVILERMASSMNDGTGSVALSSMTDRQIDFVFDEIDGDGSGKINADELKGALEKMGIRLTTSNIRAMMAVVDVNGDGEVDREEFHALVRMAGLRSTQKQERRQSLRRPSLGGSLTRSSLVPSGIGRGQVYDPSPSSRVTFATDASSSSNRSKSSEIEFEEEKKRGDVPSSSSGVTFAMDVLSTSNTKKSSETKFGEEKNCKDAPSSAIADESSGEGCVEGNTTDHSEALGRLPRTYQEALPPGKGDDRAIIVTEGKYPYAVVGVNKPWEDLCGYKSSEAVHKSMSNLIQGPMTNREGLKHAMDRLVNGADHVECTTVNYRKDGTMFNNLLTMGPLYEEGNDGDMEEGLKKPSFYVGILMNIGELGADIGRGMVVVEQNSDNNSEKDFEHFLYGVGV